VPSDPVIASVLRLAAASCVAREARAAARCYARWSPAAAAELAQARDSLAAFLRGAPSDSAERLYERAAFVAEA
jgi:hypothetical protein